MRQVVMYVWLYLGSTAGTPQAAAIAGQASVVDGDTLEIHSQRLRLHGIDAPESAQSCYLPDGKAWRCGHMAALRLQDFIGDKTVTCARRRARIATGAWWPCVPRRRGPRHVARGTRLGAGLCAIQQGICGAAETGGSRPGRHMAKPVSEALGMAAHPQGEDRARNDLSGMRSPWP